MRCIKIIQMTLVLGGRRIKIMQQICLIKNLK